MKRTTKQMTLQLMRQIPLQNDKRFESIWKIYKRTASNLMSQLTQTRVKLICRSFLGCLALVNVKLTFTSNLFHGWILQIENHNFTLVSLAQKAFTPPSWDAIAGHFPAFISGCPKQFVEANLYTWEGTDTGRVSLHNFVKTKARWPHLMFFRVRPTVYMLSMLHASFRRSTASSEI